MPTLFSCLRRSSPRPDAPTVLKGTNANAFAGLSSCSSPLTMNGTATNCCRDTGACDSSECSAAVNTATLKDCNGSKCPDAICKKRVEGCGSNCYGRVVCKDGSEKCDDFNRFCIADSNGVFKVCAGASSCAHVMCANGAKPKRQNGGVVCSEGAYVDRCPDDPCSNVTCSNGGSCKDGKCNCLEGFAGPRCEVDFCRYMQDQGLCFNGGTCSGGKCQCVNGFSGKACQISPDLCAKVNCNKGKCVNGRCECPKEYTGDNCEKDAVGRKNTVLINGWLYATLDDAPLNGPIGTQEGLLPLPQGWEIVESNEDTYSASKAGNWSTNILANANLSAGPSAPGLGVTTTAPIHPQNWAAGSGIYWNAIKIGVGADAGKFEPTGTRRWGHPHHARVLIRRRPIS